MRKKERDGVMKRWVAVLFALCLCLSLSGCKEGASTDVVTEFRFSDSVNFQTIEELDGKAVSIIGYMATLSPVHGKYMYLMNMPYQSCPFCVPNTAQLANTIAVYAKEKQTFTYTDQAIRVTGKLNVGSYTDDFSYEYNYRIVDAAYEVIDLATISSDYALWYSIASDGIVTDVNAMFDYLHFVCQWTEYQGHTVEVDGTVTEWYLYAGDALNYLEDTGTYGYAKQASADYFPNLIARVKAISDTGLKDLVEIIDNASELEAYAREELEGERYTYSEADDKFTLNADAELAHRFDALYQSFSTWLAKWQL